jgi:hypothetical protein
MAHDDNIRHLSSKNPNIFKWDDSEMPLRRLSPAIALSGLAVLATAGAIGGWEWTIICLIVLLALPPRESGVLEVLATTGVGLFWLALFHWTGDRRMFFPYSMQFAVQLACLLRGRVQWAAWKGGGVVIGVFTLIRIAQSASVQVLVVEIIVAAGVLWLAMKAYEPARSGPVIRATVAALGSVLAFVGLIF